MFAPAAGNGADMTKQPRGASKGEGRRRTTRATSAARQARRAGITSLRAPPPAYDRRTALVRVLPLWPHEMADESLEGRRRLVARLHSALRAERRRGIAGHWSYDLARHVELLRVYRAELAALPCDGASTMDGGAGGGQPCRSRTGGAPGR
jgi:hypothetical protein